MGLEKKRTNAWQWPEQEPKELARGKRAMELQEINNEEYLLLPKRSKPSSTNKWLYEFDPLKKPSPLRLKLDKLSQTFEKLLQNMLNRANKNNGSLPSQNLQVGTRQNLQVVNKKDVKAKVGTSDSIDKLKASNFPARLLKIGQWEYASQHEGDLVAKCYFAKHKLVWEVLDGGLKNKIEIQWEDILGLQANFPENGYGTLTVTIGKEPLFFREMNPLPRKHTIWQATSDFTGGEARTASKHYIECGPGVLNKHYEKLIHCDTRLNFLSQHSDTVLDNPFPEASIETPNIPHNIVSNYRPEMSVIPYLAMNHPMFMQPTAQADNQFPEASIETPNIPHNIVSNYRQELSVIPCVDMNRPMFMQPTIQPNFAQKYIWKNYINVRQDVNYHYNHDGIISSTSKCFLKDANSYQKDTSWEDNVDGNTYSNLVCNLPSDDYLMEQLWEEEIGNASGFNQDQGMRRDDSLNDFMSQLPNIAPGFLFEDGDINPFYPSS